MLETGRTLRLLPILANQIFRSRRDLLVENLAFRQQLAVLKQRHPQPRFEASDFFTVPTLTFGVLYCFFVIAHDRRRILHWEVTRHPASSWVVQQLREAFPYDSSPKYLIFDRAMNFDSEVIGTIKTLGIEPKRTSFRSPW